MCSRTLIMRSINKNLQGGDFVSKSYCCTNFICFCDYPKVKSGIMMLCWFDFRTDYIISNLICISFRRLCELHWLVAQHQSFSYQICNLKADLLLHRLSSKGKDLLCWFASVYRLKSLWGWQKENKSNQRI